MLFRSYVFLGTSTGEILTVKGANVGIGNTAPTDKFSVNGTSYLGGIVTATSNVNVTNYVNAAAHSVGTDHIIDSLGAQFKTGSGNYGVRVYPGGGTDTTMAILQLTNAAKNAQWGSFYSNGVASGIGSDVTGVPFYLRANNSTIITLAANGNAGVGNTVPTDKLSVNGTAYVTGNTWVYNKLVVGNITPTTLVLSVVEELAVPFSPNDSEFEYI